MGTAVPTDTNDGIAYETLMGATAVSDSSINQAGGRYR